MPSDAEKNPVRSSATGSGSGADPRRERLARALRDNLKKRKAQQRQRQDAARSDEPGARPDDAPADDTPGGR